LLSSKTPTTTNVGEDAGKKEPSFTAGRKCKLVQPLWKTIWRLLKKLNIDMPYDPAIPLLGYTQGNMTQVIRKAPAHPCLLQQYSQQSSYGNSQDAPLLMNRLRKCGIYTQSNFTQPQRKMKFFHSQVNGWNWRTSS
jgi:hypothetical protein